MLSILVCAILGQFKEGDSVSVKPPGARAWKTPSLAGARYTESQSSGSLKERGRDVASTLTTYFQKREKLSVLAVDSIDGEKIVKVRSDDNNAWWMIATDLSILDDEQKARESRDSLGEKLRPFCMTKPEHEALTIAVGKGLDPITMTAKDAAALSPGQRKALSAVKARYLRAKKK